MSDANWFYVKNGVQQGPVAAAQLRQLAGPGDLVWRDGMTDWVPAGTVPELGMVRPPPPPRGPMPGNYPGGPAPGAPVPMGYYAPGPRMPGDPNDIGQNAGMRMLLPVGRSVWAIVAGYLGLFSVLFCPAPIAIVISIIAIYDIKTHPERHGMGRAIFGLVMGVIFSLGLVVGLIARGMR